MGGEGEGKRYHAKFNAKQKLVLIFNSFVLCRDVKFQTCV